jgi:hypothetical protein
MDQNLLAQFTFFVTVLGVLATIIAPRLVSGARIYFTTMEISRIDTDDPTDRLEVKIFHDGAPLTDPVFLLTGAITNTGGKDITKDEFIDPVLVKVGDKAEILSVEASAPDGVNLKVEVVGGTCHAEWSILKPGESIQIKLVGRYPNATFDSDVLRNGVRFIARLRDVKVGLGIRRFIPLTTVLLTSLILLGIMGMTFLLLNAVGRDSWVYRDPTTRVEYAIREPVPPVRERFRACEIEDRVRTNKCRVLSEAEARLMIGASIRDKLKLSINAPIVFTSIAVSLVYAFMLVYVWKLVPRLLRLATAPRFTHPHVSGLDTPSWRRRRN